MVNSIYTRPLFFSVTNGCFVTAKMHKINKTPSTRAEIKQKQRIGHEKQKRINNQINAPTMKYKQKLHH